MSGGEPVIDIRGLGVSFVFGSVRTLVVEGVNLTVAPGEIHAVVGESGSGKTMLARSILGLLPPGGRVDAGEIRFGGQDLTGLSNDAMRAIRGARIGMIFQEPLVSLNPSMQIGAQMAEAMRLHTDLGEREIRARALEMLRAVRIRDPERCLTQYPHEFSGGMRQRIMIASVMMLRPTLLLADEPTTALDAVVQREVLDIMADVVSRFGTAVILVSHDLAVVARYAHRVTVMEKGRIVEQGETAAVLAAPSHPYTVRLLESLPSPPPVLSGAAPATPGALVMRARDVDVNYVTPSRWPFGRPHVHHVVKGVSLDIHKGEMVGLVGESGSGKSTLGRALIRLKDIGAGSVEFLGRDLSAAAKPELRKLRARLQIVFQDPFSSLNPRMRIGAIIREGLRHVPGIPRAERERRTAEMLDAVGLSRGFAERFPHELSGGQRQRVAIARALISRPELVVADEPVSALDVTVQAQILDLLRDLRARFGFACLFISHDLAVVESICDRVMVMNDGRIVEEAAAGTLFRNPEHPYTRQLLEAAPMLVREGERGYRLRAQG